MVSWAWIPGMLMAGMILGLIIAALMQASREDDRPKRWWEE